MTFHGPREKIWEKGARNLTDAELLAVILGTGPSRPPGVCIPAVVLLAESLLNRYVTLSGLFLASPEELVEIRGMGKGLSARVLAVKELCFRTQNSVYRTPRKITSPADTLKYFQWMKEEEQEVVCALFLNPANRVIRTQELFRGGISRCLVETREIFRAALRSNAASLILVHNHPAGDLSPSEEDLKVTSCLQEAGELLGISLLDHVIVSKKGFYSVAQDFSLVGK